MRLQKEDLFLIPTLRVALSVTWGIQLSGLLFLNLKNQLIFHQRPGIVSLTAIPGSSCNVNQKLCL